MHVAKAVPQSMVMEPLFRFDNRDCKGFHHLLHGCYYTTLLTHHANLAQKWGFRASQRFVSFVCHTRAPAVVPHATAYSVAKDSFMSFLVRCCFKYRLLAKRTGVLLIFSSSFKRCRGKIGLACLHTSVGIISGPSSPTLRLDQML